MISVFEAKKIVGDQVQPLHPVSLPLHAAAGLVLAADVFAPHDVPAFPQAAMDGYAFRFADWNLGEMLPVSGIVAAGESNLGALGAKESVRIFTGAPVPDGADTVVMQEKTKVHAQFVMIEDDALLAGVNVRPVGSEISKGALALEKESLLTPGAIGFLAGLGLAELPVYPQPSVALIVTGKELQTPGQNLGYGQVYESNSFTLCAALAQMGIKDVRVTKVDDDLAALTTALEMALAKCDMVLLTGGISVGDYDFVLPATERCGVQKLFHKVAQKPGKPLFFGKKENRIVFGLPGNPSSVLTCFYQYVVPALEKMLQREPWVKVLSLPLEASVEKKTGLTHFLKGNYKQDHVVALNAQESYRLRSFAVANCLIELDAEAEVVAAGTLVKVHLLPR